MGAGAISHAAATVFCCELCISSTPKLCNATCTYGGQAISHAAATVFCCELCISSTPKLCNATCTHRFWCRQSCSCDRALLRPLRKQQRRKELRQGCG